MNRGNIRESKIDNIVSQLDRKIGRLLGKKSPNLKKPKETSNLVFFTIIVCSSLFLWFSTGVYYLGESEYGLVLKNGHVVSVESGLKVGFTLPYPFGGIEVLSAKPSNIINIGEGYTSNPRLSLLTKDLNLVIVTAKFNYQVTNPRQLYIKHLQSLDKLDELVIANVYGGLQSFTAKYKQKDIQAANFIVLSSQFKEQVNLELRNYGIEILKFNIISANALDSNDTHNLTSNVGLPNNNTQQEANTESLAMALIKEAKDYQNSALQEAKNRARNFNLELNLYHQNPKQVVKDLYQKALHEIPVKANAGYSLLDLSLAELLNLDNKVNESITTDSGRNFSREVNRSRDFNLGHQ